MKLLITGGAGFVGANLAVYLAARGHTVTALDNLSRRGSELNLSRLRAAGVTFHYGDIRAETDLPAGEVAAVLHCAAQTSVCPGEVDPWTDLLVNVGGTWNILDYCRKRGAGIIFWSTNKVYSAQAVNRALERPSFTRYLAAPTPTTGPLDGGDHSIYGVAKLSADLTVQEFAQAYNLPAIVNRCSCLYGPGQFGRAEQGWIAWFAAAALWGLPVQLYGWGGKQVRDVLYIDDLARLVEAQLKALSDQCGTVYNVGGGPQYTLSLLECLEHLEALTGHPIAREILPNPRRADHAAYISDIAPVQERFGWAPQVSPLVGLTHTVAWLRDQEEILRPLYG